MGTARVWGAGRSLGEVVSGVCVPLAAAAASRPASRYPNVPSARVVHPSNE